jgi:tetratricopeptide (TPR) repeat protein
MVQVYIKLKNYAKANNVVDSLLMEKDIKSSTYLYKYELLYNEGKYVEANNYIDKALKSSSSYIDGLYMKSKILTKLGRTAEANKYFNIAKYAEAKRKEIYE